MTREDFSKLVQSKIVILDGATGSNLQDRGMPIGVCPEKWILDNQDVLFNLQKEYVQAGADILYAPTFTANRIKLEEYGFADDIEKMNRKLIRLSKEAAMGKALVAGNLTMTGQQLYPVGTLAFEELVDIYKEQAGYMLMEDVDLFVIETMMSLSECRAAVLAVKEICSLPVMVTLTFNEDMRTLYGTDPKTAVIVLQSMGADAVGVNCSTGPEKMCQVVAEMKEYAEVPIIAKPNAGLPKLVGNMTKYDMDAEPFSVAARKLVEAGAGMVGGCCGTTPEHIRLMAGQVKDMFRSQPPRGRIRALTTERKTLEINMDGPLLVIGERINPTGKKALQEELRSGKLDLVLAMAEEQIKSGASILDINMGMNGIDEKEMMQAVIHELTLSADIPLCIDSSHVEVIEAALRIYPGRALINSISLEDEKMKRLLPAAKKYGAMFILLPLSDKGLPKDQTEKREIIGKIIDAAYATGLTKEDIIVDGLVNTVGANKKAAVETLETIEYCRQELGITTVVGLSNISFGLPERQYVNSTFLTLAISKGLTFAIANPSQEMLMNTAKAADLLMCKEDADVRYIETIHNNTSEKESSDKEKKQTAENTVNNNGGNRDNELYYEVIKGNRKNIVDFVKQELHKGAKPDEIVQTMLIPAINEVGILFDRQKYFLPQLIASAEAMKKAIDYLEPMLQKDAGEKKRATIVIATVSGDIHDIGKNLVVLMLKNYGFHVIDLGKDVPSVKIIEAAKENGADIIGLSALMTTTMLEMKTVIKLAKEAGLKARVIIGGAVITQNYADEIGADGYSKDAQDAVKLVKRLLDLE